MLSIFADMMNTATRQDRWDPPDHWRGPRRRNGLTEAQHAEIERHRLQASLTGWR